MFCARLFICAFWSPAGKGLTSWLSFVVSSVSLSLSHWYPGSGVVLDCIDSWSLHHYLLSYSKLTFPTQNSLFLLETHFSCSKLTFLTRNSLFLLESHFYNSKLAFLTRNSIFLLETHFSYSKLPFLTRNSLYLLETHYLPKVNRVYKLLMLINSLYKYVTLIRYS